MKKYFIIKFKESEIVFLGTERKARVYALEKGGELREASNEESGLIKESKISHLHTFKATDEAEEEVVVEEAPKVEEAPEVEGKPKGRKKSS